MVSSSPTKLNAAEYIALGTASMMGPGWPDAFVGIIAQTIFCQILFIAFPVKKLPT
jgi:hypothetical protein